MMDNQITLYHGDCLEVMKGFQDKSVDLIVADPPYGIGLKYGIYEDTEDNWVKLMDSFIPEARRVSKMVIMPCCKIAKLDWIYNNHPPDWLICWYKGSPGQRSFIGFNDWEPHLVYGKTRSKMYMHDYFSTRSSPPRGTYNHPCPKPIEWANWIITRASQEGDIILDPFMGSGTTMVACLITNRRGIGIELDEKYFNTARERIEAEQAQTNLLRTA